MMDIEKIIAQKCQETKKHRLEIIASMDLGTRSEAAQRVLQKRAERNKQNKTI